LHAQTVQNAMDKILQNLIFLYGQAEGEKAYKELQVMLEKESALIKDTQSSPKLTEKDLALITYADSFYESSKPTLPTLNKLLTDHLKNTLSTIHILPFNPFSSDHGFSVIDYREVEPKFGTWNDIGKIAQGHRLMADLVLNHVSAQSEWFKKFQAGDPAYQDYFISFTPEELTPALQEELKKVFRPRSTPLLTPFETAHGKRYLWTTISVDDFVDQIDLNYKNPKVLLEMLSIFLFLLQKGVRIFRLDAITFIWKELGTNCVHLPQGHAILQIFRSVLDEVCTSGIIITETNVPHKDNISYFGNGKDEAHMVYNFALPPLTLHALYTNNATHLTNWAKTLKPPSEDTAFFNFLSCHDGIGIMGARGVLPDEEIEKLFEIIVEHGTKLSYKSLPNGDKTIYEMCATWWSAVSKEEVPFEETIQKFLTSYALCFALAGVPAVYYLSLFGKANDIEAWKKTEHNRDILRTSLEYPWLEDKLADKDSKEAKVFAAMKALIKERTTHPSFHPNASQEILDLDPHVFAILRKSEKETLLALHNVSRDHVTVEFGNKTYELKPYGYLWVTL
jgi:glucosylglycerate phosphorylase